MQLLIESLREAIRDMATFLFSQKPQFVVLRVIVIVCGCFIMASHKPAPVTVAVQQPATPQLQAPAPYQDPALVQGPGVPGHPEMGYPGHPGARVNGR